MSHSDTFANLGGVILVIFKVIFRKPFTKLEVVGVLIAIIGCSLTILDPKAAKADASIGTDSIVFGDMLALISSFSAAFYFTLIENIQKKSGATQIFISSFLVVYAILW